LPFASAKSEESNFLLTVEIRPRSEFTLFLKPGSLANRAFFDYYLKKNTQ
jgi:hypothetical protein